MRTSCREKRLQAKAPLHRQGLCRWKWKPLQLWPLAADSQHFACLCFSARRQQFEHRDRQNPGWNSKAERLVLKVHSWRLGSVLIPHRPLLRQYREQPENTVHSEARDRIRQRVPLLLRLEQLEIRKALQKNHRASPCFPLRVVRYPLNPLFWPKAKALQERGHRHQKANKSL